MSTAKKATKIKVSKRPTKKPVTRRKPIKKVTKNKNKSKKPLTRWERWKKLRSNFLARRPHRSFRLTPRRDYVRSLRLPGYISFTNQVFRHLWNYKKLFATSIAVYSLLGILFVGIVSQDAYSQSTDLLKETGTSLFSGGWGEIGKSSALLLAIATGGFDDAKTEVQQVYGVLLFIIIWMSTVWILRAHLAGNKPRFRDSLYNSSTPLISTLLIGLLFTVQLIPAAIGTIIYQVSATTLSGALAMMVFVVAILLAILSLYLVTSTFFALVIVTLPGMYPWQAVKTAGDLVIGRRIRILLRLLWGAMTALLVWILVMAPVVILTMWLQDRVSQLATIPIVPILLVFVSSTVTIFLAAYVYMLYRKVVDDEANPA